MSYMNTFNGLCGDQQFDFETIMKDYLISYLLEWNPRWDPSRTNQKCPLWTPFEKNSPELDCAIKDKNKLFADGHADGIIPTASAPTVRVTNSNYWCYCWNWCFCLAKRNISVFNIQRQSLAQQNLFMINNYY